MVLCCALGCCGSCAGACGSYCLCKACEGCIPKKNNARYHYAFLTLLSCVVGMYNTLIIFLFKNYSYEYFFTATILQQFGDYPLFMTDFKICSLINADRCKKNASVFRIFTVLSLFFFIHVIMVRIYFLHFFILLYVQIHFLKGACLEIISKAWMADKIISIFCICACMLFYSKLCI